MTDLKLALYHRMPPFFRNLAATFRGYQLRSWRYGSETERLIEAALERDSWSIERWQLYQQNQLSFVLNRAATKVPFYQNQWAARRRQGDRASSEYLENWQLLSKAALRENPLAFLADDCNPNAMYVERTSGTTGTPLSLYISRQSLRHWYALFEARWRRWYGLSIHENWAILGGQPILPAQSSKPPFWVWNAALRQLYMSANHVSPANAQAYAQALRDYHVTHLVVYPSSATFLAQQLLKQEVQETFSHLRAILTNAEPLFDWQREQMSNAFGCPVYETYSMGEMVIAASADTSHRLRLWCEPGYVEVLDDFEDRPTEPGQVGRLVCTSLLNMDMPLVRYQVGDRSGFAPQQPQPQEAIQHPVLLPIQGRNTDMLISQEGRRIFWINPVFYELPLVEAQVIQDSLSHITIRYVPSQTFNHQMLDTIQARLLSRLGSVQITFEQMEQIPRGANGKFRAVISNLSPEERARVDNG